MSDNNGVNLLTVIEMMWKNAVSGRKHHQPQTIAGWFATHDRGDVKDLLDQGVSDRTVPIRQKGRGTVQLTSMTDAKRYLVDHGCDPRDQDWK